MKNRKALLNTGNILIVAIILSILIPFAAQGGEPQPGDVISTQNVEQYKDYFPDFMPRFITDGWGFETPVSIHVREYGENLPPKHFIEAGKANAGKVTFNADGSLNGYVSGLPFPDPKEPDLALKVMWNLNYHWKSDQFYYPGGFWATSRRKGGSVNRATSLIDMVYFTHRTVVEPIPNLPNPKGLFYAMILNSQTPPNKDMATLTWRYEDVARDDEMWTYVPTLRRTIRLVSSERSNPVRGTLYTWDDFYGFDGKVTSWAPTLVVRKKMLALMNQNTFCEPGTEYEKGMNHPILAGKKDPWELREIYVIDVKPKAKRHPESKKTLYISDDIYFPIYSAVYDRNGKLWKGGVNGFKKVETDNGPGPWMSVASLTDFKTGFWTQNLLNEICADCEVDYIRFNPGSLGTF